MHAAVWGRLRLGAARRGIGPGELGRVRRYLGCRYGLEDPRPAEAFQRPRHFFPGLTARPWHDGADFGWTTGIEESADAIRAELVSLLETGAFTPYRRDLALRGQWTAYRLWSFGEPFGENLARCPETARALDSLPFEHTAGLTYFSALGPGTRVAPHCGPTNTRLRCHLGLVVPEGCGIRVGSEARSWSEGRCIVFDDSFEHEVWNDSDRHRHVLILDVWHPDLTPAEIWAVTEVERLSRLAKRRGRRKDAPG